MPRKITDDELLTLLDNEIRKSVSYMGDVAEHRRKNLYYYLGEPIEELAPPAIDGRSSVVSTDVADTIEWMLPSLLKIFTASDDAVEFTPKTQADEQQAKDATAYINHIFYKRNPGFAILQTWFKDAMIQRLGTVKCWWKVEDEEAREEYQGLTEAELILVAKDDAVQIVEQRPSAVMPPLDPMTGQPLVQGPLFDIVCTRNMKKGRICIENVPPEEFYFSRKSKHITDGFSAHRVKRTLSYLKAAGYKNVDRIVGDDTDRSNAERDTRDTFQDADTYDSDDDASSIDPSLKEVYLWECYMPIDVDGDGIAEWRKITKSGNAILDNVECDGPPFITITPIVLPHRLIGLCPADQAREMQRLKTAFLRALMDNAYLQVNGRTYAVNEQVNLDDLMTTRPGGVVRVATPQSVGPLQDGRGDLGSAHQLLEYLEIQKENRTGFTRYSQGTDANSLNKTATGVSIITNKADARVELIARNFAETGVQDLFLHMLKLIKKYQDGAEQIGVNGRWLQIDPRAWSNQFNFSVNVGLGTGNKDQQAMHLQQLMAVQAQAVAAGKTNIVNDTNLYNAGTKLAENLGFKQPELFFSDPSDPNNPAPQPGLPPEVQKMIEQGQQELQRLAEENQKLTIDNAQLSMKAQQKDYDTQVEKLNVAHAKQIQQLTDAAAKREQELDQEAHMLEVQRTVDAGVAKIRELVTQAQNLASQGTQEAQMQENNAQGEKLAQMVATMGAQISQSLVQALSMPRQMKVTRGADGTLSGESTVAPQTVQ